jgi:phospholipid transport system substrate-binding protein
MRNRIIMSRRATLQAVTFAAICFVFPMSTRAQTAESALVLIRRFVSDVNAITRSGKPEAIAIVEVNTLFKQYSDLPTIARSALGVTWKTATDTQKRKFVEVFSGYLSRKYTKIFGDSQVAKIGVSGTRKVASGYLLTTTMRLEGGASYFIEWHIANIGGQDKMVNVFVEGISMVATERREISVMLEEHNGNLDSLILNLPHRLNQ